MKYLWLLWAGVWRKPVRAALLMLSIVNAFLLFGLLEGFEQGFSQAQSKADASLLITGNRVSLQQPLPVAYGERIRSMAGVVNVSPLVSLQGSYRDPSETVRAFALDPETIGLSPGFQIAPQQLAAFKASPSAAIVSEELAKTYGWHVGDRVPIRSRIWTNKSGEPIWPVDIVGIYRSENTLLVGAMLLQFRYLDEGRIAGRGMVNSFLVRVSDPAQAELVAPAIDRSFANSAYETKTSSEQQIARDTVKRVGDIGLIINAVNGAVLFALILSVGAVMIQTGRERRTEVGVLKALGYSDLGVLALVVGEAMLTCVLAGAFGLGLAAMALPIVAGMTHLSMVEGRSVLLPGLGLAGALGFLTGLPPAVSALRLRVADVLAGR